MLRVSNHIHDQDPSLMESLDSPRRGYTNRTNKQLGSILDCDFDEIVKLAVCVIVVRLARTAANLREREIDSKRKRLVVQIALQLVDDGLQLLGRVTESSNNTEPAGIGYSGC